MKKNSIKTLVVAAITMAAMAVPTTANAQLGGLVNKAKKNAEQAVDKKKNEAKKDAKKAANDAKAQAYNTQRPDLPWPMAENGTYNGTSAEDFLHNIVDVPKEELETLRQQMDARFKSNSMIIKAGKEKLIDDYQLITSAENENQRWWDFYGMMRHITNICLSNVEITKDGAINKDRASYLVIGRGGGGIGYYVIQQDGKFKFTNLAREGAFLNSEDLKIAQEAAQRMRQFQILTRGIHLMLEEAGEKYDMADRLMFNMEGIYAMAVEEACKGNTPENIEYQPMPKAGSMHAKYKAEALAIAKQSNKDVIDVVITSNDWDVKMKGLVPSHRSIYGYIITQDEHGKICSSRAWTQSYQGNGNYGKLRAGGVGVTSDFYVK